MAWGFPASFAADLELDDVPAEQDFVQACSALGWRLIAVTPHQTVIRVPISWSSWSERIEVYILSGGRVRAESWCTCFQIFDWDKNRENLRKLESALNVAMSGAGSVVKA